MTAKKATDRIPASAAAKKGGGTRAVEAVKRQKPKKTDAPGDSVAEETVDDGASQDAATGPANEPVGDARNPFGVRRLDALLAGGLKPKASTLLYGPPYLGKEHLSRMLVVEALRAGTPAILIHTDKTATDELERLAAMEPSVADAAKSGLLHLVDCYSRAIDADEQHSAHVHYVDGAMDLNGISVAANEAQRRLQVDHDTHILVVDSLSTMITYTDPQTAFRFLQVLLGKSALLGASSAVLLEHGMHSEAEVQTFRHLTSGAIELRDQSGKTQLRVLGISDQEGLSWIDYRYHDGSFELTGSFAPGRIR